MPIFNEDCINGMKKLKAESVDIIIADPPYNIGKDFGNDSDKMPMQDYVKWCKKWIKQCLRVLRSNGTMFIYGFGENLAFLRPSLTCNVRQIIWHYTNKCTPSLNDWQRSHETIYKCWKDTCKFNKDLIREPYTENFKKLDGRKRASTQGRFGNKETKYSVNEKGALPRDVIKIPALAGGAGRKERVDHPTQKPLELCKKLILSCYNEGDTVLIPFAGSGSECLAAQELGLNFIAYELNEDYVTLCLERLNISP